MSEERNQPDENQGPADLGEFAIQEVKYSLPIMLRELQIERSQSYFAREIIDQMEISKLFAQARKARARAKQS